eukprot:4433025-Amphidinium_carterae.1
MIGFHFVPVSCSHNASTCLNFLRKKLGTRGSGLCFKASVLWLVTKATCQCVQCGLFYSDEGFLYVHAFDAARPDLRNHLKRVINDWQETSHPQRGEEIGFPNAFDQ